MKEIRAAKGIGMAFDESPKFKQDQFCIALSYWDTHRQRYNRPIACVDLHQTTNLCVCVYVCVPSGPRVP
jgi:hypothetical protein